MGLLAINVGLAVLPSLVLLWYFYRWDRARSEPRKLLLMTFFI